MPRITAHLSDDLVSSLEAAAARLHRSRAEVVSQAVEYYLADLEDTSLAISALRDPADPVLDWEKIKRELHDHD